MIPKGRKSCQKYGHDVKILGDFDDAVVEVCKDCGDTLIYNKAKDGTIDNARYYKEHLRYFVQPKGPTAELYREIYGVPKDTSQEEKEFWDRREQQRLDNLEQIMKQGDNSHWFRKHKRQIEQGYEQ